MPDTPQSAADACVNRAPPRLARRVYSTQPANYNAGVITGTRRRLNHELACPPVCKYSRTFAGDWQRPDRPPLCWLWPSPSSVGCHAALPAIADHDVTIIICSVDIIWLGKRYPTAMTTRTRSSSPISSSESMSTPDPSTRTPSPGTTDGKSTGQRDFAIMPDW